MIVKNLPKYLKSRQNLERSLRKAVFSNWSWKALSVALLALVIIMWHHEKVFFVPYGQTKPLLAGSAQALVMAARMDADTYFNVTPTNIHAANATFLTRVSPAHFGVTQVALAKRAAKIQQQNISTVFYPGVDAAAKGRQVTEKGVLVTRIAGQQVARKSIVITILYRDIAGHQYIEGWHYD